MPLEKIALNKIASKPGRQKTVVEGTKNKIPWIIKLANTGKAEYEIIAGEHLINSARNNGQKFIDCQLLEITYLPIGNVTPNELYQESMANPRALQKKAKEFEEFGLIQPLLVRNLGEKTYEIITGLHCWLTLKKKNLAEIPCIIMPFSEEEAKEMTMAEYIHEFGEYGILHHPKVEKKYKKMKQKYLGDSQYPEELRSQQAWEKTVHGWVEDCLDKIIENHLQIDGEDSFNIVYVEKIKNLEKFKQLIAEVTAKISEETFHSTALKTIAAKIQPAFVAMLNDLAEGENWAWMAKCEINSRSLEYCHQIVLEHDMESFFQERKAFHSWIGYKEIRKYVVSYVTNQGNFKQIISAANKNQFKLGPLFDKDFAEKTFDKILQFKGKRVDDLFDEEFNDEIVTEVEIYLEGKLNELLFNIQQRIHTQEELDGEYLAEDRLKEILLEEKISDQLYGDYRKELKENEYEESVNEVIKLSLICLLRLREPESIAQGLIKEVGEKVKKETKIADEFRTNMLSYRNSLAVEFKYLPDNCDFEIENSIGILSALRVVHASNKRLIKEKVNERDLFFKPKVKFSRIKEKLTTKKDIAVMDDSDGTGALVRTYKIKNLGSVTETLHVNTYGGDVNRKVTQFESYDIYKQLRKIVDHGQEEDVVTDQQITFWFQQQLRGNSIASPPEKEIQPKRLKIINDYLKPIVFCLFYIEGMRNPAAFVTHGLMLLQFIDETGEDWLEDCFHKRKFPMSPADESIVEKARIANGKYIPDFSFFSDPQRNTSDNLKKAGKAFLNEKSAKLEQREVAILNQVQENEGKSLEEMADAVLALYELK